MASIQAADSIKDGVCPPLLLHLGSADTIQTKKAPCMGQVPPSHTQDNDTVPLLTLSPPHQAGLSLNYITNVSDRKKLNHKFDQLILVLDKSSLASESHPAAGKGESNCISKSAVLDMARQRLVTLETMNRLLDNEVRRLNKFILTSGKVAESACL